MLYKIRKLLFIGIISIILFLNACNNSPELSSDSSASFNTNQQEYCMVDIRGEVIYPGIYKIEVGSLVNDVIELAGGVTINANLDNINLVSIINENIKIVIPSNTIDNLEQEPININTCTIDQLMMIPKIGITKATAIIEYRNNNGFFLNIDELKKVIMNYYYKEHVEYVFYDTLKTDIDNIGNGEELKKTATILSNLAQNFNMFIGSTLQLAETVTDPINLNINDLAVSRTVKEVLDTLCLFKQIHKENYKNYEYSLNEVDDKFFNLKDYDDPDERYYACVVDKNRAGAKPKVLFNLNLAYNRWVELGYLRLKDAE